MQQRKNGKWIGYLLCPLAIEWIINILVKGAAQFCYVHMNVKRLEEAAGKSSDIAAVTAELSRELSQYATELTAVAAVITIPILWYLYQREKKQNENRFGWQQEGQMRAQDYIMLTVMGAAACIGMNSLVFLSGVQTVSENYQAASTYMYSSPFWIQLLGLGILIPVKEELVYRVLLYRRMRERAGFGVSLIIVSVLFGINHGNLVQFLFAAVLGGLLGYSYEKLHSAAAPVLLHIVINLTSLAGTWTGIFEWMSADALRMGILSVVSLVITFGIVLKIRDIN